MPTRATGKRRVAACTWGALLLSALLTACASRAAPGISGRWRAVDQYPAVTEELPLSRAYVFRASPIDRTLKAMLTRWARESRTRLVYQHPSDFTLYGPVAELGTGDLREAAARLSALYAAQHVIVSVHGDVITVCRTDACATDAPGQRGPMPAGSMQPVSSHEASASARQDQPALQQTNGQRR